MRIENQTEEDLVKELQNDVKQEKIQSFIIKNTPKALGIFALFLVILAGKLFWDSKKNLEYQANNDKLANAIELYQHNKIAEANAILDELVHLNNFTGEMALYIKNAHLGKFLDSDIEALKKSRNNVIKELVMLNLNEIPENYKIFKLLAKEKEIVQDINMKNYDVAMKKIEDNFTNVKMLPSIEQRIDAYKKIIQVRKRSKL